MTIYNNPDYGKAQRLAYETVYKSEVKSLPISVKKIIRQYPNLYLMKYTEFSRMHNLTLSETIIFLKSEDGCIWRRGDNTHTIFYNDTIDNKARIRFTLAHELGHFLLRHNEIAGTTMSLRNDIKEDDYIDSVQDEIFEKEANYFAKRLLAPIPLIDSYLNRFREISANGIENIFMVSYTLSRYLISDLERRRRLSSISSETHAMNENFEKYVHLDTNYDICPNCSALINHNSNLCKICGEIHYLNINYDNYLKIKNKRSDYMIYSSIEVNEHGYAIECPRCGNEDLSNNQKGCQICGTHLKNICIGDDDNSTYDISVSYLEHLNDSFGCETIQGGDARFCHQCGGLTSFYMQDLLSSWQNEKDETANNVFSIEQNNYK